MTAPGSHGGYGRPPARLLALFGLLGLCAGLPLHLYTTILALRLAVRGVDLTVIGLFAWIGLLPTLKFLWAPLVDRIAIPGFAALFGVRRAWIVLAQAGIVASVAALAFADPAANLATTALAALLLAYWATLLEIASDAWRIEIAPGAALQGPVVTAYVWGYRIAMVVAASGVLLIADRAGWVAGHLAVGAAALVALVTLCAMPRRDAGASRTMLLATGLTVSVVAVAAVAALFAGVGHLALILARTAGIGPETNIAPWVIGAALLPFVLLAMAVPALRRLPADARLRRSAATGPFVDLFWRYGFASLAILAFVALYRMGDVLALTLSKPFVGALGYSLTTIGIAEGAVALAATIAGVGLGGWLAARRPAGQVLAAGALLAAIGNVALAWLGTRPVQPQSLYLATAADQFGNGFAGAVFVVYLSLIVNPAFAAGQFAFLSGFAFLLPRLIAGSGGALVEAIGYPAFFVLSGALSMAAIVLLPLALAARPRAVAA